MYWQSLRGRVAAGILCLLWTSACSESPTEPIAADVEAIGAAVIGGEPVESCAWPTTIGVNAWGSCTGTLIHPRVITTAAHCLTGPTAVIFFGASRTSPGSFSLTGRCRSGAQNFSGIGTNRDWGYCVLPEDLRVERLPITPPLIGCEADRYLKVGAPAWVVGFGTTSADRLTSAGIKRQVQVKINTINRSGPGTIEVGDAEAGACYGDSGGPVYMRVGDDAHDYGYRVLGSTTSGSSQQCNCTCGAVFVNIAAHVREIEETERIDVTPCTDADGNFEPSERCKQFPSAPQQGSGLFPLCNLARTSAKIDSCRGAAPRGPAAGSGAAGSAAVAPAPAAAGSGVLGTQGLGGNAAVATGIEAIRDAIARGTAIVRTLSGGAAAPRPPAADGGRAGGAVAGAAGAGALPSRSVVRTGSGGALPGQGSAPSPTSGSAAPAATPADPASGGLAPGAGVSTVRQSARHASCQAASGGSVATFAGFCLVLGMLLVRTAFRAPNSLKRRACAVSRGSGGPRASST